METLIIANPVAGGGRGQKLWKQIEPLLKKKLGPFKIRWTKRPGEATDWACRAESFEMVVAYGGDGTIQEVTNGLLPISPDSRPLLGILSVGTGSDLIKTIGIPADVGRQIEILAGSKIRKIDVGQIEFAATMTKRYFLNIADAGLGADVLHRLAASRKLFGRQLAYLSATLEAYRNRRPALMEVVVDQTKAWTDEALLVAIANGRYFGGGMKIAPAARLDDGLFEVVIVKDLALAWIPVALALLYSGQLRRLPQVELFRGSEVEIRSREPVGLDIDGEPIGSLPARFINLPHALRIKSP